MLNDTKRAEVSDEVNRLSNVAIGAAIEVHRHLGPGYLESVYEEAMAIELRLRGVSFERQFPISIPYKGERVGSHQLDFVIEQCLVIELKAVDVIAEIHTAQLLSYLKTTQLTLGLLLNFKAPRLREGIHRIIRTEPTQVQ